MKKYIVKSRFYCYNALMKDDTAPILVWGKYTEQNGKYIINMTLDVNHRFIDGYFVGQFVQKLEEKISELD